MFSPIRFFRREGENLLVDCEIRYTEAVLGTVVEVPTLLEGTRRVRVPAGTQPGAKIRLRGTGLQRIGGKERGDTFVCLKLQVPKKVSKKQKELLEALAGEGL